MAHKFKDNEGREWSLALNGWQLKNLKERINFDARDSQSILQAANDPAILCDVLFVLCEDQCKAAGVSGRQFGESLGGDAIESAAEAYIQATIDFFPQRQRQAIQMMLAKMKETQNRAMEMAKEKLTGAEMEKLITKELVKAEGMIDQILAGTSIGNSSGNVPASPA